MDKVYNPDNYECYTQSQSPVDSTLFIIVTFIIMLLPSIVVLNCSVSHYSLPTVDTESNTSLSTVLLFTYQFNGVTYLH
jgi:hypothetical protein